ncbi:MAG: hypothetical protein HOP21_02415 [Methylotenera sp.]|nr:hypothetical protein [Methylotenera sp.]
MVENIHNEFIKVLKKDISNRISHNDLSRKIFLSYKTAVFKDDQETEYKIKSCIQERIKTPFSSIQVTGSSKTGFSFFNRTLFTIGVSDLDVSIINLDLYNSYLEAAHKETRGFTDLTKFPLFNQERTDKQFLKNLQKGFINPFYMPESQLKKNWLGFFREISNKYTNKFGSINGAIYASEYFFEQKQVECIEEFERNTKAYDSLSGKV